MTLDLGELGQGGHQLLGTDNQILLLGCNPVGEFKSLIAGIIKHHITKVDP